MAAPREAPNEAIRESFYSGKYSGVVICCGDREWKVHKMIICSRSKYFSAAFEGEFKESKENRIELKEDDPDLVNMMLKHLYGYRYFPEAMDVPVPQHSKTANSLESFPRCTYAYRDGKPDNERVKNIILANLYVYDISQKYMLPDLQRLASSHFVEMCGKLWDEACKQYCIDLAIDGSITKKQELPLTNFLQGQALKHRKEELGRYGKRDTLPGDFFDTLETISDYRLGKMMCFCLTLSQREIFRTKCSFEYGACKGIAAWVAVRPRNPPPVNPEPTFFSLRFACRDHGHLLMFQSLTSNCVKGNGRWLERKSRNGCQNGPKLDD